ncbi:hypothetical protein Trydic_g5904 [Trypoxylus dichotomus]
MIRSKTTSEDVPNRFSCQGRASGYYADVSSGCQVYHMCDGLGRQFSYSCPNTTLFQQRMLICDHWYMVNCSRSEGDYTANLLIGQQKPFVEDSEKQMYYRTPRPDLLTQPTASEINIIYRTSPARNKTDLNLVGVNSDSDQNNGSSILATSKPSYQLPSHWSTEFSQSEVTSPSSVEYSNIPRRKEVSTRLPIPLSRIPSVSESNVLLESPTENPVKETRRLPLVPVPKAINFNSNNLDNVIKSKPINSFPKKDVIVNFKSSFKATTPVFPTKEELGTTEAPLHDILTGPIFEKETKTLIIQVPDQDTNVNFKSSFKATTPVFPTKEELGTTESPIDDLIKPPNSENGRRTFNTFPKQDVIVNFNSLFKATTPVFPTKEELGTTEASVDDIIKPPVSGNPIDAIPRRGVNFVSLFKATTPVFPTKEELATTEAPVDDILKPPNPGNQRFEIPLFESAQDKDENADQKLKFKSKTKIASRLNNEKVLKELRKMFSIPDYEFPLDSITRPDYGQKIDSFHANPYLADVQPRQHAS